jgi:hypothetical protein
MRFNKRDSIGAQEADIPDNKMARHITLYMTRHLSCSAFDQGRTTGHPLSRISHL